MPVEDALGHIRFGLADNEGTIRDVVERTGTSWARSHRTYDSFGQVLTGQSDFANFSFGLNGMPLDVDTNLYQTDTAAYDPATARRLSEDWSGFDSGTTNLTIWVSNDPWNNTDPTGRCGVKTTGYSYFGDLSGFASSFYGTPYLPSSNSTVVAPTAATIGGLAPSTFSGGTTVSANLNSITASQAFVGPVAGATNGLSGLSGFGSNYLYYLTNPSKMDSDLQTSTAKICVRNGCHRRRRCGRTCQRGGCSDVDAGWRGPGNRSFRCRNSRRYHRWHQCGCTQLGGLRDRT